MPIVPLIPLHMRVRKEGGEAVSESRASRLRQFPSYLCPSWVIARFRFAVTFAHFSDRICSGDRGVSHMRRDEDYPGELDWN